MNIRQSGILIVAAIAATFAACVDIQPLQTPYAPDVITNPGGNDSREHTNAVVRVDPRHPRTAPRSPCPRDTHARS